MVAGLIVLGTDAVALEAAVAFASEIILVVICYRLAEEEN